jgi:hypothetical protein
LVYNASVVKIYSATNRIAHFIIKIIFLWRKNALAYVVQCWRCSYQLKSQGIQRLLNLQLQLQRCRS